MNKFLAFKKRKKYGLHKLPDHIRIISSKGIIGADLLDLLCKQISDEDYGGALNTISTMHGLLGYLPRMLEIRNPRIETILRLNTVKKCIEAEIK